MQDAREARLVRSAVAGDREAFGALATGYRDSLYSFAARMLGDHDAALDAAQEALVRAWSALDRFDAGRPFRPWLFAICANICTDTLRRRRPQASLDDPERPEEPDQAPAARGLAEEFEAQESLTQALGALSEIERTVVILKHVQGWSYPEISRTTGLPVGTLKSHAHRGRRKLAEALTMAEAALPEQAR